MTVIHEQEHPLAGQTVRAKIDTDSEYVVEDWWDRVYGSSWMFANGNPACIAYAIRKGSAPLPTDNEVVYGKMNGLGYLVHDTEILPKDAA